MLDRLAKVALCSGVSLLLHVVLISAVKPHVAKPFRSVGIAGRLAVEVSGGTGLTLTTFTPQNRMAAAAVMQQKESLPAQRARRAVLIPQFDFAAQPDPGDPTQMRDGNWDWGLASLNLPQVPDRYFSAGEVDIRAEPVVDLIPPETGQPKGVQPAGRLKLRLLIDEFGTVTSIEIMESVPLGFVEESVPAFIKGVLFNPARLNGLAVKSEKVILIDYSPDAQ